MKRAQPLFHAIPAKGKIQNPIMKKKKVRKPKLNNLVQNNCPVIFKNINVMKVKEKMRNYSRD